MKELHHIGKCAVAMEAIDFGRGLVVCWGLGGGGGRSLMLNFRLNTKLVWISENFNFFTFLACALIFYSISINLSQTINFHSEVKCY